MSGCLLVGLSACAPATPDWTAPGASQAEVDAAWADCRRLADRSVGIGSPASMPDDSSGSMAGGGGSDPMGMYERSKAADTHRKVMTACMKSNGFAPKRSK